MRTIAILSLCWWLMAACQHAGSGTADGAVDGAPDRAASSPASPRTLVLAGVPATVLPVLHGAKKLFASPNGKYLAAERVERGHRDPATGRHIQPGTPILVYDIAQQKTRVYDGELAGPPGDDGRVCWEEDWRTGEVVFSDGQRLSLQDLKGRAYTLYAAPGCSRFVANVASQELSSMARELWALDGEGRRLWKQPVQQSGADRIAFSPSGDKLVYSVMKIRA